MKAALTWIKAHGAFYACLALLAVLPLIVDRATSALGTAYRNGYIAGENAAVARAVAVEREQVRLRLAAERKADAAVTSTRHAEAKATEASAKAATASARLRAAISKVDTVRDTVIAEVVRESAALIVAVDTLTKAVDSLNATVRAERAAHAAVVLTWKEADDALRIVFASVNARLAKAERRPTRKEQVVSIALAAAGTYATCKAVKC